MMLKQGASYKEMTLVEEYSIYLFKLSVQQLTVPGLESLTFAFFKLPCGPAHGNELAAAGTSLVVFLGWFSTGFLER
jgi:hypothetical protein